MYKRRILSILLIGVMAVSVVGCKDRTTQPKAQEETTTIDKTTEENSDAPNDSANRIAEGCTYYVAADDILLEAGEIMPDAPQYGDKYETTDYVYEYGNTYSDPDEASIEYQRAEGWNPVVKDRNKTSYEELLSSIAGKAVNSLCMTFYLCKEMTSAPKIPDTVTDMARAFLLCENLETAPTIPSGVKDMSLTFQHCLSLVAAPEIPEGVVSMCSTFNGCLELTTVVIVPASVEDMSGAFAFCEKLTGELQINANPSEYEACFYSVDFETQNLNLTGSSNMIDALRGTAAY